MSAQVAADLRAAADLLERDGWTQEDWGVVGGCRCAAGAIIGAINPLSVDVGDLAATDEWDRWFGAKSALLAQIGRPSIPTWNDHPDRTATEVITALRAAADAAEVSQ